MLDTHQSPVRAIIFLQLYCIPSNCVSSKVASLTAALRSSRASIPSGIRPPAISEWSRQLPSLGVVLSNLNLLAPKVNCNFSVRYSAVSFAETASRRFQQTFTDRGTADFPGWSHNSLPAHGIARLLHTGYQ